MKKLPFFLLLMVMLVSAVSCDRVTTVQPYGVDTSPAEDVISLPVKTVAGTQITQPLSTQAGQDSSKVVEVDSPIGQESALVEPTATLETASSTPTVPSLSPTETAGSPTSVPTVMAVPLATYTLQKGEWAVCVARRYNLDLDTFFAVNQIDMKTNYLPAGFIFKLPAGGNWSPKYGTRFWHKHPDIYVVKPEDTIQKIACFYGDISPEEIEKSNGLSGTYSLMTGQKLTIP